MGSSTAQRLLLAGGPGQLPSAVTQAPRPPAQAPHDSVHGGSGAGRGGSLPRPRVCPPLPGPASPPAPFRPTRPSIQPPALLHTISLQQRTFFLLPGQPGMNMPLPPCLALPGALPETETPTPRPRLRHKPKSPPNPRQLVSQNPGTARKSNHRPQIRRCLGAEPRPESPSLLSPDTWRPSLPTAHLGPTRSQRLGRTRDHPSSPHHGQTR